MTNERSGGLPSGDIYRRGRISAEEIRLFREVIHEYCGLTYGLDSALFLERRLGPRIDALGLSTYREYYHYLRYDPSGGDELENLVERLTTHETYLFREQYQLDAFREEILPEVGALRRHERKISVWSAGCSTGEEVYTIAMLVREDPRFRNWKIRVVGSDISRKVIAHARRGLYSENSFRTTDLHFREAYFESQGSQFRVRDEVRALCSFGQLNLLTTDRYDLVGSCDVIFCRNVLMYLSTDARHRIVETLYDTLLPGGYLLLGHSESLLNVTSRFDLVHLSKDLIYRRPISG